MKDSCFRDELEKHLAQAAENQREDDIEEEAVSHHRSLGDFPAALKHIDTSLSLNPLAPNHFYTKANIYYLQGEFEKAITLLDKALTLEPDFVVVIELKLACQIQAGLYEGLKESMTRYDNLRVPALYELMYKLIWEDKKLDRDEVQDMIHRVQQTQPALLFAWDLFLLIHCGEEDESMRLLQEKVANKVGQIINFKHDPFLQPLRHLKAYDALVQQHFSVDKLAAPARQINTQKALLDGAKAKQYTELLLTKMEQEKRYLAPDLNLRELAREIDLHPNKLSWLLNNKLQKNFSDFVNSYRLREFQVRALDERYSHLSLLGLAYESGFNSKSVFNEYFRKVTGLTPRSWVKQHSD
ncbi:MAG: helix-turn-helix domain-containing protein [Saprospiraceae bacterium]|nr:helix-turn-helix domain-containing protein [Saprospiraceae bacterium]